MSTYPMQPKAPRRTGPKYREAHLDRLGLIARCGHRHREIALRPGHSIMACREALELYIKTWERGDA